jgi:cytochrome c
MIITGVFGLVLAACGRIPESSFRQVVPDGDPGRGYQALQGYGCISCHSIPGISRADALVAPPLDSWSDRRYLPGQFPNAPENLISWIMALQALIPGSAMPAQPDGFTESKYHQSPFALACISEEPPWKQGPNVFATGAALHPLNAGINPAGPLTALSYWTGDAIVIEYLREPNRSMD